MLSLIFLCGWGEMGRDGELWVENLGRNKFIVKSREMWYITKVTHRG